MWRKVYSWPLKKKFVTNFSVIVEMDLLIAVVRRKLLAESPDKCSKWALNAVVKNEPRCLSWAEEDDRL